MIKGGEEKWEGEKGITFLIFDLESILLYPITMIIKNKTIPLEEGIINNSIIGIK